MSQPVIIMNHDHHSNRSNCHHDHGISIMMTRCGGAPCSGSTCHCPWGSSGPTCQQAVQLDRDVRDEGDDDHYDSIDKKVASVARLVKHRKTMHNRALQLIIDHYSNQNW